MSKLDLSGFEKRANEADKLIRDLQAKISAVTKSVNQRQSSVDQKVEKPEGSFTLLYWPLKNRGNYVRLMFAEADVKFKDVTEKKEFMGAVRSTMFGKLDPKSPNAPIYQSMGPPLMRHGNFELGQTTAIVEYLAKQFDLMPSSIQDQAFASMLFAHVMDINSEVYKAANDTRENLWGFLDKRLPTWLDILEIPLRKGNKHFYFDSRVTFIDLMVVNILDGLKELLCLGDLFYSMFVAKFPALNAHFERMTARPRIASLLNSQKGIDWFGIKMGMFNVANFVAKVNQSVADEEVPSKQVVLKMLKEMMEITGETKTPKQAKKLFNSQEENIVHALSFFEEKFEYVERRHSKPLTVCSTKEELRKVIADIGNSGYDITASKVEINGNRVRVLSSVKMLKPNGAAIGKPVPVLMDFRVNKTGKITFMYRSDSKQEQN